MMRFICSKCLRLWAADTVAHRGTCPFCGGLIQRYNRVCPEPVRCEHCSEISKLENERLSPYDPNAVAETRIFSFACF